MLVVVIVLVLNAFHGSDRDGYHSSRTITLARRTTNTTASPSSRTADPMYFVFISQQSLQTLARSASAWFLFLILELLDQQILATLHLPSRIAVHVTLLLELAPVACALHHQLGGRQQPR